MKKLAALIVLLLFAPAVLPQQDAIGRRLTAEIEQFHRTSLVPGFAVAIVDRSGVVYSNGLGVADVAKKTPYTPQTINWVASVSKTFIALSIVKLVEQHKLDLDEPINSILPYRIVNPHFPDRPITVRQLVTHTSSIVDSFEPFSVGEADVVLDDPHDATRAPAYMQPNVDWHKLSGKISLDENIRKFSQPGGKWYAEETFLDAPPGTRFQYSNLGASIAARIVEIKSGMSFEDFTARFIFEPLGMKNTAWKSDRLDPKLVSKIYVPDAEQNPTGVAEYPQYYMTNFPVSGLKTNVDDLALYLVEMIRGSSGSGRLLSKESYRTLFEAQLTPLNFPDFDTASLREGNREGTNMAVFWTISSNGAFNHLGGNIGVSAFVRFDPATNTGALAIGNLRNDHFGETIYELTAKYEKEFAAATK